MLKENSSLILDMQKAIDIGITAFSFIAAYFIKRNMVPESLRTLSTDPNYYIVLLMIIIAWYISFKWMNMYQPFRQHDFWLFFTAILKSCFM
ncbi:MAG: sugar transferase, partial [Deltaproteobacteria bacterium]|nr:sugar transferase [Deltaproteobacteria bacterium]